MDALKFILKIIKSSLPSKFKYFLRRHRNYNNINKIKSNIDIELIDQSRFYLSDDTFIHSPLSATAKRVPKKIYWDRDDSSLKNHFYTHEKIFSLKDNITAKKFAWLYEARCVMPDFYRRVDSHLKELELFDAVFTHDEYLLTTLSNAKYCIVGGVQYSLHKNNINSQIKEKKKNISIVSSYKKSCELHRFRLNVAKYFLNSDLVDCYGDFHIRGKKVAHEEYLSKYRYSIVVENQISKYYFTEKICNCFEALTIPIYIGAENIGDFFNKDGIIQIHDLSIEELKLLVQGLDEFDYMKRIDAVKENYKKVQQYKCAEDWIFNNYEELFFKEDKKQDSI